MSGKSAEDPEARYEALLNQLPSRAPIYLPTDKIPLEDKIRGAEHVLRIYRQDLDTLYRPRLRALRERFKGSKRCFLIGNGPSLNRTDLAMLRNEVTFAVNGFFLKAESLDWKPTFYVVEDHLVAEDRVQWINAFDGPIKLFPAYLGYMFDQAEDTIFYNHRPRVSYPHGFDFSLEADKITYTGCTVTFSMMQLAAYFGFEEIYLVGVDASYAIPDDAKEAKDYGVGVLDMKSDDPNHFDPNYFGKGFRWHDPQVDKMVEAYAEARRTLEGTGQAIYNATVGGELEVFERRDFNKLFALARSPDQVEADNRAAAFPRLLMLDMTPMGNGTATGEIKSNLTRGWPAERLLQLARHGRDGLALVRPDGAGKHTHSPVDAAGALEQIKAFDPDVILYRPVPNVPWLHDVSMNTIRQLGKPVMTWIMDDWPAELEAVDPVQWAALEPDLHELLEKSAGRLSISERMSQGMGDRYGQSFTALANGVNPEDWTSPRSHAGRTLRIRYAGGLARNMSLDSVLRIARTVERLGRQGHPVMFQINTQKWWHREAHHEFEAFQFTTVETENHTPEAYRAWLSRADVAVIAYNFDETALRYMRYSLANKMPECLASGAVLLAHGPTEAATIDYLQPRNVAVVVSEPDEAALEAELLSLLQDPARRQEIADRARTFVFENHDLNALGERLRELVAKAGDGPAYPRAAALLAAPADGGKVLTLRPGRAPAASPPAPRTETGTVLSLASRRGGAHLLRAVIVETALEGEATAALLRGDQALRGEVEAALSEASCDDGLKAACEEILSQAGSDVRAAR